DAINKQLAAATDALAKVDADLAWQATGVAADIAGTIDPTPVSDLVSAGVSVRNGDLWGAALSTVSMVPYLGDAVAKPVKAVRATKTIAGLTEKATALRKTITDLTKAKKQAEAAEVAAKEAKIANEAVVAKNSATQQKGTASTRARECEQCGELKAPTPTTGGLPTPPTATASKPSHLRSGQQHEADQLAELGIAKNNEVFRPTAEQIDSATFKAIVGDAKYTKGGLAKGTIFDGTEKGYLEIKGGKSELNSSYQLRLQTYKALIDKKPYTIQTTRPVNQSFKSWLDAWGAKLERPK
ncbi:hypothetical protein, partial [Massilia sp. Root418]|uniref:hypothetical protein n=1 Tax=Massilia sp. Root418 TaxID=1736532 RepID=UPI000A47C1C3